MWTFMLCSIGVVVYQVTVPLLSHYMSTFFYYQVHLQDTCYTNLLLHLYIPVKALQSDSHHTFCILKCLKIKDTIRGTLSAHLCSGWAIMIDFHMSIYTHISSETIWPNPMKLNR